jgi:methylenetetrahydrofolate reductase (NADPH)
MAGAEFVQTQFVFDVPRFAAWMSEVRDLGVPERCSVIAGVGPLRSVRVLEHVRDNVPGTHVPDAMVRRLRGVPPSQVAGVHVMAFGFEHGIPEILVRSGLGPRRADDGAEDADRSDGAAHPTGVPHAG